MITPDRVVPTTCPYCGVGCNLRLHVRDDFIYKVTSPFDSVVNRGNLTGRPNEILAGNHVVKAMRNLGHESVEVDWVDVDEETAARIVLIDNRSSDGSTYDEETLSELIASLATYDGTGFKSADEAKTANERQVAKREKPEQVKPKRFRPVACLISVMTGASSSTSVSPESAPVCFVCANATTAMSGNVLIFRSLPSPGPSPGPSSGRPAPLTSRGAQPTARRSDPLRCSGTRSPPPGRYRRSAHDSARTPWPTSGTGGQRR